MLKKSDVLASIRALFAAPSGKVAYAGFQDSLENFRIPFPANWKFDPDIAIVEGRYTITFQSPDGQNQFTVAVDAQIPPDFDFAGYAKQELESPSAGIYADVKKGEFRGMEAYRREYAYLSGRKYFGGGVMFFNGACVFSLSWSGPEERKNELQPIFERMMDGLEVRAPDKPKPLRPKPMRKRK